jgi:hypothetical protein
MGNMRNVMIVHASPIIPSNKDRSIRPMLAGADGIDNGSHPRRPRTVGGSRMIGGPSRGHYPTDGREVAKGDVRQHLCGWFYDLSVPIGAGTLSAGGCTRLDKYD